MPDMFCKAIIIFHHLNYTFLDIDIMDITLKMYLHHVF